MEGDGTKAAMRGLMTTSRILLTFLLVLSGCAAAPVDEPSASSEDALDNGSGGTTTKSCSDKYGDCYIGCSVKYPESGDSNGHFNAQYRQGGFHSRDPSHDLCSGAARTGGFP